MGRALLWVFAGVVGLLMVAPVLIVIPFSFSASGFLQFPPGYGGWVWYDEVLNDPAWRDAAWMSVKVGLIATVTATMVGTAAALAIVRGRVRFQRTITAVLVLPMVVPIIIFALGSYAVGTDLRIVGSIWALGFAHAILALPLVFLNVRASLQLADPRLEMAGRSLGASPLVVFWKVTLPLILPGVVSGAVLAFVLSFDETVVALFMTNDIQPTLPVKLFSSIRFELEPTVAAVSVLLLVVTLALLVVAWLAMRFNRRRLRGAGVAAPGTTA